MADQFFNSLKDTTLPESMMAKQPDAYIQKFEDENTSTLDITVPATATFTPVVASTYTVNEFASTQADNLYFLDDDNEVCAAKIISNIATAVTFDSTSAVKEKDGTAANLTTATDYSIRILSPSNTDTQGPFFGYVEGLDIAISDEIMPFKYSTPRQLIRTDLLERTGTITGGNVSWVQEDVLKAIMSTEQYGNQTGQFSIGFGSNANFNKFYKMTFSSRDVTGRPLDIVIYKTQFQLTGSLNGASESGHSMISFTTQMQTDPFYPCDFDMGKIVRNDTASPIC